MDAGSEGEIEKLESFLSAVPCDEGLFVSGTGFPFLLSVVVGWDVVSFVVVVVVVAVVVVCSLVVVVVVVVFCLGRKTHMQTLP